MPTQSQPVPPAWLWYLFPAVTMSLGWGLRGTIGGGPLGAMIPGAMIGLALCLLLGREKNAGFVAAFAAIGVGFGGQETYGQTVHVALAPETFSWGILGFTIKGAVWGLLGGACIGLAFVRDRFKAWEQFTAFALMVLGTYAGWKLFNQPKLVYFSNPIDKPRDELYFGLFLGGLLLLLWLAYRGNARLPLRFALWGILGGGLGFGLGAAIHILGRLNIPDFPLGWWKIMEFTFGAILGASLGHAAWTYRTEIPDPVTPAAKPYSHLQSLIGASIAVGITLFGYQSLGSRLGYTIGGAFLLCLVLLWESIAWQTAITATCCAFFYDLLKHRPTWPQTPFWVVVILLTLLVSLYVGRNPRIKPTFLLLTISSTLFGFLKVLSPPSLWKTPSVVTVAVFVGLCLLTLLWLPGRCRSELPSRGAIE